MKKYIFSILTIVTFFSCEKSVEFNNPAFQGFINGSTWKSNAMQAKKSSSGALTISGTSAAGLMELRLNSVALGKRILGGASALSSVYYTSLSDTPAYKYSTIAVLGPVNMVSLISPGTGYTTSSLVPTIGGSGTGLKVDFETNSSGEITTIKANSPGNFYKAGDVVTVTGGGANATFLVQNTSNSNGEITITEFDGVTVSGNFKFIAFDATATPNTAVCREGIFYKIPVN